MSKAASRVITRVPGSVTARLDELKVGECLAEAKRFTVDRDTPVVSQNWMDKMVRQMSVNVNRVKKANPSSNYVVERVTDFSQGGALLCVIVVTRLA